MEAFANFQAGFLTFEDFHRISWILMNSCDFRGLTWISDMDLWDGKARAAAPIKNFARFQSGFLCFEDFHEVT